MRNVSDKRCRGNKNTHFMFVYLFIYLFFLNCAVYEITWENIVERGKPQMTVLCMCIACWIPGAKNTHTPVVTTYWFSTATMVA
jgi:hypothetical protein